MTSTEKKSKQNGVVERACKSILQQPRILTLLQMIVGFLHTKAVNFDENRKI